eukprot:Em0007g1463a
MAAWCCLVIALGSLVIPTLAQRDRQAYCGACKAVVDELHYSVSKEDPHKTIETGSFRVNSKGQQVGVTSKRYAGSEAHLTELMEGVCDLMSNYGVSTDTKTGTKSYIRINSRAGESITLSNVNFSSDGSRELKNACTHFVSEYEDDIISLFKGSNRSKDSLEKELCSKLCTKRTSEL